MSMFVHEGWETNWAKTGHNFYMLNSPERKNGWKSKEREMPNNYVHTSLDSAYDLLINKKIDAVVCHTPIEQRKICEQIANKNNLPLIEMNHCLPYYKWPKEAIIELKKRSIADAHVFTTEEQARMWGYSPGSRGVFICNHAVDMDVFKLGYTGENETVLSVAYDFKEREEILGYDLWNSVTKKFNRLHIGNGEEETLATAAELANDYYINNRVFINTAKYSTLPTSMLEAMACGMPVITVNGPNLRSIFKNKENCIIEDDPFEIMRWIAIFMNNKKFAVDIGLSGNSVCKHFFDGVVFKKVWNEVFNYVIKGK